MELLHYNKTSTNVALELDKKEKKESWLKINIIIYCNSIGSILKNTRKLRKQFHVFQINHTHNHNNDDIIEYNIHQISYTLQFKLRLMIEYWEYVWTMLAVVYEIMVVSTDFKYISCGSFIVRKGFIIQVIVSPTATTKVL